MSNYENIPNELKKLNNLVGTRGDSKAPQNAQGGAASSTGPNTWSDFATAYERPDCYEPNDNPYPLCKGANTTQGLAENGCSDCCLYENMKEDWE